MVNNGHLQVVVLQIGDLFRTYAAISCNKREMRGILGVKFN